MGSPRKKKGSKKGKEKAVEGGDGESSKASDVQTSRQFAPFSDNQRDKALSFMKEHVENVQAFIWEEDLDPAKVWAFLNAKIPKHEGSTWGSYQRILAHFRSISEQYCLLRFDVISH